MFGKIKDRLKNVFNNSEEIIEENPDEIVEVPIEEPQEEIKEEKSKKDKAKKEKTSKKEKKKEEPKEEELEKEVEEDIEEISESEETDEEEKKEKKGFFSRVFGKKDEDEDEVEEIEELQDEMLEEASQEEKEAVKEKKELKDQTIEKNKKNLEKQIQTEEKLEEETIQDIEEEKSQGILSKTFTKLKSKKITEEDFEKIWIELEIFLLEINIAFEIVEKIEQKLREALIDNSFNRFKLSEKIREVLEIEVEEVLSSREADLLERINDLKSVEKGPIKILVLGVNGTGKTTTIAKIVNYFQKNNLSVVVAAADTFRAAAVEQLEEHSKKLGFKLIQHKNGSDPAAVAFDSIEHAKAKNLDIVLIDTAGRMPNNSNLMQELKKVKRVSEAQLSIFIGDSISGNDLIDQIHLFNVGVEVDGVILTKVDTDERPGSIVTTAYSIDKPIYFLGVGQGYDDLEKFDANEIAKKLFELED